MLRFGKFCGEHLRFRHGKNIDSTRMLQNKTKKKHSTSPLETKTKLTCICLNIICVFCDFFMLNTLHVNKAKITIFCNLDSWNIIVV